MALTGPVSVMHTLILAYEKGVHVLTSHLAELCARVQNPKVSLQHPSAMAMFLHRAAVRPSRCDNFRDHAEIEVQEAHRVDANLGENVSLRGGGEEEQNWRVWL